MRLFSGCALKGHLEVVVIGSLSSHSAGVSEPFFVFPKCYALTLDIYLFLSICMVTQLVNAMLQFSFLLELLIEV